ncbi:hypothetical protein HK100_009154, partial [Physocladia obscura]
MIYLRVRKSNDDVKLALKEDLDSFSGGILPSSSPLVELLPPPPRPLQSSLSPVQGLSQKASALNLKSLRLSRIDASGLLVSKKLEKHNVESARTHVSVTI